MRALLELGKVHFLVFLTGLSFMGGCSSVPSVKPEEVYKSDVVDAKYGGSKNISVEDTQAGQKVVGKDFSLLVVNNGWSFRIEAEPKDQEVTYKMTEAYFDPNDRSFIAKAQIQLGQDSTVAARLPLGESKSTVSRVFGLLPGVSGSKNVAVRTNLEKGMTVVAGLTFKQGVVLNVWDDGIVELDQESVTATDRDGQEWVSKKVRCKDRVAVLMVKKP